MAAPRIRLGLAACVLIPLAVACAKSEAAWRAELADRDPFVRALAAIALAEIAPERASAALPVLLETVDRPDLGLQAPVARELARLAPAARETLVATLARDDFLTLERRAAIASALVATGPAAAETLVAALRGGERARAAELAEILVRLGPAAVAPLAELVAEPVDGELAALAATTLARIGAPARAAISALRTTASHPDPRARAAAEAALRALQATEQRGR